MTAIDFLTDHLVNIDCLFDNHDKGDQQKPHSPIQIQHNGKTIVSISVIYKVTFSPRTSIKINLTSIPLFFLPEGYSLKIFRPPIV